MALSLNLVSSAQIQKDSSAVAVKDSTLSAEFDKTTELISAGDSLSIADSLRVLEITQQLQNLRRSDAKKKAKLLAEIDSLQALSLTREQIIKAQVDSVRSSNRGVPVVVYEDTLFYIFAKLGPFNPSQRAASISEKVEFLCKSESYRSEGLSVFRSIESDDILYEETILLSVTDRDAFWQGEPRAVLSEMYRKMLDDEILTYHETHSLSNTIWRFSMLALVIVGFIIGITLLNKGFSTINKRVMLRSSKYIKGIRLRDYEFLTIDKEKQLIRVILKIIKWTLILIIVYLALPAIFSIFPATEGIAATLIGYVMSPLRSFFSSVVAYIPSLISIIVILVVSHYFVKLLSFFASELRLGNLQIAGFYPEWAKPTLNIFKIIVYAFTFIVIFPYLPGSESPVFQGVSVFLGLLISLGSSSAISNIIAGLVITYMRAFRIGDRVRIGDVTGDVLEKNLLVTRLRTIKNEDVSIPNSAILSGSTVNFSSSARASGLILYSTVTIGYDVPWREVHKLLIESALKCDHVEEKPEPYVLQTSLDDFYVSYQINFYTYQAGLAAKVYSQLHSHIQDNFNKAGVEIMSPHYRAARDGNETTIPSESRAKGYKVPTWRMPEPTKGTQINPDIT